MSKKLYYECTSGISGDMHLGAMIDLGVDIDYLKSELSKLKLDNEFKLEVRKAKKMGIAGTKLDVVLAHNHNDHKHHDHTHDHSDDNHHHTHDHHHHKNGHEHSHEHNHHVHSHNHQRNLKDIQEIISNSTLSDKVKKKSLEMFGYVAEAEAKVHDSTIYDVHFHEVGAVDSIVDIVGAAICLDYLEVDEIVCGAVEVGSGFVRCDHGKLPVPAPATALILQGIPITKGGVKGEATTPTGAAILKAYVTEYKTQLSLVIEKVGHGLGTKDFEIPNMLRVYIAKEETKKQCILECNIDDMNPEWYEYIEQKLFDSGALDVYKTPIIMKKGRPAIKLSILCKTEAVDQCANILLSETTTVGYRKYNVEKIELERKIKTIDTEYGPVKIKTVYKDGQKLKSKAEYEDCKAIAIERGISIRKVYQSINGKI